MFRCAVCRIQSAPRAPQFTLVTARRERAYEPAPRPAPRFVRTAPGETMTHVNTVEDAPRVSCGWEIVTEQKVCAQCHKARAHAPIVMSNAEQRLQQAFINALAFLAQDTE